MCDISDQNSDDNMTIVEQLKHHFHFTTTVLFK